MARVKQTFIATRSKAKALREATKRGIQHPIATKVPGGFVVYQAYAAKNPSKRRSVRAKRKRNPSARGRELPVLYIRQNRSAPWVRVAVMASGPWAVAIGRRLHKTGLGVRVTKE